MEPVIPSLETLVDVLMVSQLMMYFASKTRAKQVGLKGYEWKNSSPPRVSQCTVPDSRCYICEFELMTFRGCLHGAYFE